MQVEEKVLLAGMEQLISPAYCRIYGTPNGILEVLANHKSAYAAQFWKGYSIHILTLEHSSEPFNLENMVQELTALGSALHVALPDKLIVAEFGGMAGSMMWLASIEK